ncbi:MAG: hypothetical protein SGJ13_09660 [Actinomycetota bacterium]|nr:hypothetical protein [Actinomycetota bacterium]
MTVDPSFTFGIALLLSLVLWWNTLQGLLRGNVDIMDAGLRYLMCLGFAWLGVYLISTLVAGYGREQRPPPPPAARPGPQRRAEDQPQTAGTVEDPAA